MRVTDNSGGLNLRASTNLWNSEIYLQVDYTFVNLQGRLILKYILGDNGN